jgi:hypothetical protein
MANIIITIDTDNAAFEDDSLATEVARILRGIARQIAGGRLPPFKATDGNGNIVATVIDHE